MEKNHNRESIYEENKEEVSERHSKWKVGFHFVITFPASALAIIFFIVVIGMKLLV